MLKKNLWALLALPLLSGCVAMGLAGAEAFLVGGTIVTAAAVAAEAKEDPSRIKVYGNYADEHGYWFDKERYFVNVVSDRPEESERVARATATGSCEKKGASLRVGDTWDRRLWPPFAAIWEKRYEFDMEFRCDNELDEF